MNIVFIDRSTRLKTINDLKTIPRGGMVQSLFRVSDYLASNGHHVQIFSDIETSGVTRDGVHWINQIGDIHHCCDVLILNRGIGDGYPQIEAKKRVLWTHDLPHSGFIPEKKTIIAFNATVFMSHYAERIWRTFFPTIAKSFLIPNGVDDCFHPRTKSLRQIIYFSHPNRGLKRLDFIADCLKTRVPGTEIHAYSNATMYPTDKEMLGDYVDNDITYTDGNIIFHDPLPADQLARVVGQSGLMIMPTGYPEICSNSVLQALKSATPIITTGNLGATPEWVKHRYNGMLTQFLPNDYMVHTVEIVRYAVEVLTNPNLHSKLMKGCQRTKILTWNQVGQLWEKLFVSI